MQILPSQEQNAAQNPRPGPSLKFSLIRGREAGFHLGAPGWIWTQPQPWPRHPASVASWRSLRHLASCTPRTRKRGRVSVTSAGPGALRAACDVRARGDRRPVSRTGRGSPVERGRRRRQAARALDRGPPGPLLRGRVTWGWANSQRAPRLVGPFTRACVKVRLSLFRCEERAMTIQWAAVASFLYAEIGLILIFCLPFIPPQR